MLEDWLGRQLFRKSGRQLELTEHGRLALGYADQIFSLGQDLETALRQARGTQRRLDFRVGVADSVSKSVAYRLLEPAFSVGQPIKLLASEGKFDDLLAQLALHRLDLVIADEPMPARVSVKAFNHPLGRSAMSFLPPLRSSRAFRGRFPAVCRVCRCWFPGPRLQCVNNWKAGLPNTRFPRWWWVSLMTRR